MSDGQLNTQTPDPTTFEEKYGYCPDFGYEVRKVYKGGKEIIYKDGIIEE